MIRDPYSWGGDTYPKYDGFLKGDSTAKAAEQQQMQFTQQLMGVFQQQFAQQSSVLNFLKGKLQPMISNPTGYAPQALAAMRANATDTIAGNTLNAERALQNKEAQTGNFSTLPSGVNAQLDAALLNSESQQESAAQNEITLNNENLKQQNYWKAVDVLSGGVASQFNPLGYASGVTGGSNAVAGLSDAYSNSQQAGFFNHFANSFGTTFGHTLGGGNASQGGGWLGMGGG